MKKYISLACAALLVFSLVLTLGACSSAEETDSTTATETVVYTESLTKDLDSSEKVLAYFNSLVNNVKLAAPSVNFNQEIKVDNKTINILSTDGTENPAFESLNKAAPGIKDLILTDIKKKSGSVGYGEGCEDIFFVKGESWASELSLSDIDSAVVKEVGDNYFITITFAAIPEEARAVLANAFELRDKATVLNSSEFAKAGAYLKLNDYTVEYAGCSISATVNRLTDELTSVYYSKQSNVSVNATGLETFADYGDMLVNFTLSDTTNFNFGWTQTVETSPLETTTESVAETAAA